MTISKETIVGRLRAAPLGILLIAGLLTIVGVGLVAGGGYLFLVTGSISGWATALAWVCGPAILYLTYHLIGLAAWTWKALVVLVALLFLSSLARLAGTPGLMVAPLVEILIELLAALYLARRTVRRRFMPGSVSA